MGLNFIFANKQTTRELTQLEEDINKWERKINITIHFTGNQRHHGDNNTGWLNKEVPSTWETPPQAWEWEEEIQRTKKKLITTTRRKGEETPQKINEAIEELKSMKEIHILPADKGRNTVLWKTTEYDIEAMRQLNDGTTYERLDEETYNTRLEDLARICDNEAEHLKKNNHITSREERAIKMTKPKGSNIYFLPKPHKGLNPRTKTFYGRPVVATHSAKLHLIDKYITAITTPLLQRIPGSLKDTGHLLKELPKYIKDRDTRIATADVIGLYPNIPWQEGTEAATRFYEDNYEWLETYAVDGQLKPPPTPETFRRLLELVLQNSYITFKNRNFYKQTQGTAMGTCVSVYFANTYMYAITRRIIENPPPGVTAFLRYIDDILIIYETETGGDIETIFQSITNNNIKYTIEKPALKQPFLDLSIEIDQTTGRIETETYWKETSSGSFLHPRSNHPAHTIRSIPKSQFLRLSRNSSTEERYRRGALRLKGELLRLTYPKEWIKQAMAQAEKERGKKGTTENQVANSIKLITTYNRAADKNITAEGIKRLHEQITNHYGEGTETTKKLKETTSTIVTRVGQHMGTYFTKDIKNPRNRETERE